jgi:hypothetical protein
MHVIAKHVSAFNTQANNFVTNIQHTLHTHTHTSIPFQIFVEIHYNHVEMHPFGWGSLKHSRNEAQALFTKARDLGMFIHPWP